MKLFYYSFGVLLVSNFISSEELSETGQSHRNLQTVIKILLGEVCLCKCGVPNFSIEEYRKLRTLDNFTNNGNESLIKNTEGPVNITVEDSEKIEALSTADTNNIVNDNKNEEKLIGGDILGANGFPWMVLIIIKGVLSAGGAIITDKHVVTAASPFLGLSPTEVKISLGIHDRCIGDAQSMNVSVSSITLHPSFLSTDHRHDIAILTLSSKLTFNKVVSPICLTTSSDSNVRRVSWVASWLSPVLPNLLVPRPQPNCVPKVVRLPTLTNDECLRASSNPIQLTYEKLCLGPFGARSQICSGDVGSPVQIVNKKGQFELSGILIDSNVCDTTQPNIFIRVDQHISWIRNTIKSGCLCKP